MHFLYIIYSPTSDKFHVGETSNVPERIDLHNSHKTIKTFTGAASDWEPKLIFKCRSKAEAVYLEKFIKKKKSREFIEKAIRNPELLDHLVKERK